MSDQQDNILFALFAVAVVIGIATFVVLLAWALLAGGAPWWIVVCVFAFLGAWVLGAVVVAQ